MRDRSTRSRAEGTLRLRVACEVHFGALRQQPLPTALTTASKTRATGFRAHPRAEPVLLFPCAFGSL